MNYVCRRLWLLLIISVACGSVGTRCLADIHYLSDPATAVPVTIERSPVSLKGLLRAIQINGCSLTCSAAAGGTELEIFVHHRPLKEVMSALARLLDGNWLFNNHTHSYHFYIHKSSVQFASRWWSAFDAQRTIDRETAYRQCLYQMTHPANLRGSVTSTGGPGVSTDRLKIMLEEGELNLRAADSVEDLPLAKLQAIAEPHYGLSQYAYHLGLVNMGYFQNPPVVVMLWLQLPQQSRVYILKSLNLTGMNTTRLIASDPLVGFLRLPTGVEVQILRRNGPPITAATIQVAGSGLTPLNQTDLPEANRINAAHGVNISNNLDLLGKYAAYSVWPMSKHVTASQNSMVMAFSNTNAIPRRRSDMLQRIAEQGHQDIVADFDWQIAKPLTPFELKKPLASSISSALNKCSQETDSSWYKCKSGIVVDRDNRWYRDVKLNVANNYLAWAMQRQAAINKLTGRKQLIAKVAFETRIWRELTPWQFMNGFKWAELSPSPSKPAKLAFGTTFTQMRQSWPAIDFAATLSGNEQRALVNDGLKLSSLNAAQLQKLQQYYPQLLYLRVSDYGSYVVKVEEAQDAMLAGSYVSLMAPSTVVRLVLTVVPQSRQTPN